MSENRTLAKERGESERSMERVDSTVKEGRFRGGKEWQAKRIFLGESMSG